MECMKKKDEVAFGDDSCARKHEDGAVPLMMLQPIVQNASGVNIDAGSIYEIAHIHLPPTTPINLRSARVVLVSEKTDITVEIKYPSMGSLAKYFSNNNGLNIYPELDEKFMMGIGLAARVLLSKVPFQEIAKKKQLHEFWHIFNDASKKGGGLSDELKNNGMLTWGTRRKVRYLGKHSETTTTTNTATDHSSSSVEVAREGLDKKEEEVMKTDETENDAEDEDEENEDEGEKEEEDQDDVGNVVKEEEMEEESEEEEEEVEVKESKKGVKRKRYNFRASVRKPKKVKLEKKPQKKQMKQKNDPKKQKQCKDNTGLVIKQNKCRQLIVLKNPKDRWSTERYKLAEKSLWEVMKAKGALANNPILRPALRVEARKKIGDTGLLDHLLKHMAGNVAPCGNDRFRRRHNAEGQMEYWLESADLVDIRKQAGVNDPYWIPPPGWELGDSVTQDPIFAKELKVLKEEIQEVKSYAKKKYLELEKEVRKLKREIKELKSNKKMKGESQALMVSSNHFGDQKQNIVANYSACTILDLNKVPQDKCKEKFKEKEKCKEKEKSKEKQNNISDFVKELQEKLKKLESKVEERSTSNSALMMPAESFYLNDTHQEVKPKAPEAAKAKTALATEEGTGKAAKIERLRSGFRICKPQGTFLWPNMMSPTSSSPSQQVLLQMEDLLVPTPPSISLTPPRLPYQHQAPPLVRPLAERRRGFTVTASTVSESTTYEDKGATNTRITTTTVMPHPHFMGCANEEENC
ncbi:hypothetical protein LIER_06001 [Lithospermum erythrorhizon]|uniref:PTC1-like winged helix-turn-helix domain-containing protein n=1 Tax=Lithospermum erythrorhizon TaxID=34254 RepID=A0AAV3P2X5_LITER